MPPAFILSQCYLIFYHKIFVVVEQEELYMDNLKASVIILRKLSDEWKGHSGKAIELGSLESLRTTLNNFLKKVWCAMIFRRRKFWLNRCPVVSS